jgi:hypothetical protein
VLLVQEGEASGSGWDRPELQKALEQLYSSGFWLFCIVLFAILLQLHCSDRGTKYMETLRWRDQRKIAKFVRDLYGLNDVKAISERVVEV